MKKQKERKKQHAHECEAVRQEKTSEKTPRHLKEKMNSKVEKKKNGDNEEMRTGRFTKSSGGLCTNEHYSSRNLTCK